MGPEIDDTLQNRIAQFIGDVRVARATNGTDEFSLGTTVGSVRDQNQDRAILIQTEYLDAPERDSLLGIVADGMGGLIEGDKAATIAISVFASKIIRTPKLPIIERLRQAASAANAAVFNSLHGRGGTTLSAMLVSREMRAIGVNVGDSRIYGINRYRDLKQLSRDDTLGRVLGTRQVDPLQKNRLVQFVGIGEGMEAHIVSAERASFNSILISTDGIHGGPSAAIAQLVKLPNSNREVVRRLVALSDLLGTDNGTALIMSTQLSEFKVPTSIGINLRMWSAFDRLEILIPASLSEIQERDPTKLELRDEQQQKFVPTPETESKTSSHGRSIRKQKKKLSTSVKRSKGRRKNRKTEDTEAWLPIDDIEEPALNMSFPERRRR